MSESVMDRVRSAIVDRFHGEESDGGTPGHSTVASTCLQCERAAEAAMVALDDIPRMKPLTLIWRSPDGSGYVLLDPDDRASKPHRYMSRWERSLLRAALKQLLDDIGEKVNT